MSVLWDLIQARLDEQDFPPSGRRLAKHLGVSAQTLTNWKGELKQLPERENIEAVATFVGQTYAKVLEMVLVDIGYGPTHRVRVARGEGDAIKRSPKR